MDGLTCYERACTPDEAELLDAHQAATIAAEQAELTSDAQAERDGFFATLRSAIATFELDSTCPPAAGSSA